MSALKVRIERIFDLCRRGKTPVEIARKLGVSVSTIRRYLPQSKKRKGNYSQTTKRQFSKKEYEVLVGNILGDGTLVRGGGNFSFILDNDKRDFVSHVYSELKRLCKPATRLDRYQRETGVTSNGESYRLRTKVNPAFRTLYEQFYRENLSKQRNRIKAVNKKKWIPGDLELTKTILRYWYLGDGSINSKSNHRVSQVVRMSTEDLPVSQLRSVVLPQLHTRWGIKASLMKDKRIRIKNYGYYLVIPAWDAEVLLGLIGPSPVKSYRYKFKVVARRRVRLNFVAEKVLLKYWGKIPRTLLVRLVGGSYTGARYRARIAFRNQGKAFPSYPNRPEKFRPRYTNGEVRRDPLVRLLCWQERMRMNARSFSSVHNP